MPALYLIRHGQASFGAEDYDQLSDLGMRQSQHVGEYFSAQGIQPDTISRMQCSVGVAVSMITNTEKHGRLSAVVLSAD